MLEKLFPGGSHTSTVAIPLAFRMPDERAIRLSPDTYEPLLTWRFLSHHIRRYPLDLRAHVQRILLANNENLREHLEGSLMDLFIALGGSGSMLKERMLAQTSERLSDNALRMFTQWLQEGNNNGLDRQWRSGSMLTTGENTLPRTLITLQRAAETSAYNSVMEEVQSCLEYGQIELAQELLEQEVLAGRADQDIEQELLNIYQYTRNRDRLDEVAEAMAAAGLEPSNQWKTFRQEAENW